MGALGILMSVLQRLNDQHSMEFIEHFDPKTGTIQPSNHAALNINDLSKVSDIDNYLGANTPNVG